MKCYQTYIRSWKDYIEWAEKLEYDLKSRYVLFQNFKDVHDKTFREYQNNKIRWKEKTGKRKKNCEPTFEERYKTTGETNSESGLYLKSSWKLSGNPKEGQALGHCVGSYIPHIANRECDVYFIRKRPIRISPFYGWLEKREDCAMSGERADSLSAGNGRICSLCRRKLRLLKGEEEKRLHRNIKILRE